MFVKLLLAFILIPLIELTLLIKLSGVIGVMNTIGIAILTAVVGAYLARMEGTRTLLHIRTSLDRGIMPTDDLIDALIIFASGAVLLTPGFLTDICGLLLLFPPSRHAFREWLKRRLATKINKRDIYVDPL
ncbi:MAG: FxsA family protein [Desulfovermiculus sp.]|nr:FxsA family protein [Desulfovermiculus sp.]